MNSLLESFITLQLNSNWQAIGAKTGKQALIDMAGGSVLGMVIDGDSMCPATWEDWIQLPPPNDQFAVQTPFRRVRLPTVVIAVNYRKMPMKRARLTRENVYSRDKGRCAYTGKLLSKNEATLDHVIPASRGGKRTWTNLVLAQREVNLKKANKTPQEAGLRLLFQPTTPKELPVSLFIKNVYKIQDWERFLFTS